MITAERLRSVLSYDERTGMFVRKITMGSMRSGSVAGSVRRDGYRWISVDGIRYFASDLAWLYVKGCWPCSDNLIDHINRIRDDNRFDNLREASYEQNSVNSKVRRNSTTGFKGVVYRKDRKRFVARIRVRGDQIYLGWFDTAEAAGAAYDEAARAIHGQFAYCGAQP
jgi:hypothetical protein